MKKQTGLIIKTNQGSAWTRNGVFKPISENRSKKTN